MSPKLGDYKTSPRVRGLGFRGANEDNVGLNQAKYGSKSGERLMGKMICTPNTFPKMVY